MKARTIMQLRMLVLAVLVLAGQAGACTRMSSGVESTNPWTHPGVLRWGMDGEPDNLNPMLSSLQVTVDLSMLWAGYLFNYNDRNEFEPELATVVPTQQNGGISRDGLSITYRLRSGVRWQDGVPFTADDVIYSWRQVLNPKNNVPSRLGYDDVKTIDRVDDRTIVVRLKKPYAPFVATFFTMSALTYPVLPKHLLERYGDLNHVGYNSMPVGTGPFKVVEYSHGEDLRLLANPSYWRGPPKLHEVYLTFVPDQNTLVNEVRSHEVDLVTNLSLTRAPDVKGIDGTQIYAIPFTYFVYLGFNTGSGPASDSRVRRALALGIDRRALLAEVTHGYSLPADSDQPPFLWAHASGLPVLEYDPAAAAKLLDDSGWRTSADGYRYRSGRRLDLVMASSAGSATYKTAEQIIQAHWRALGVNLTVKNLPDSVLYAPESAGGVLAGGKFDVYLNGWFNGVDPDDSPMFECSQVPPLGDNYTRFCDPVIDRAETVALTAYARQDRKRAYDQIQRELAEKTPALFLWFAKRVDVANSDLKGYKPAHAVTTFWNSWQWSI